MELNLVKVIDARDVAAGLRMKHPNGITVRVLGEKLILIADQLAHSLNVIDLDGDGVPEILGGFAAAGAACFPSRFYPSILRWNGRKYRSDGKYYIERLDAEVGKRESVGFFASKFTVPGAKRYVLHVYRGPCVKKAHVLVDDEDVPTNAPIELADGCHTLSVEASGAKGGRAFVFVEERLRKKAQQGQRKPAGSHTFKLMKIEAAPGGPLRRRAENCQWPPYFPPGWPAKNPPS
ncbi:MAG: hypothetical protein ABI837_16610, partial [Acidobacteriota bacterium]